MKNALGLQPHHPELPLVRHRWPVGLVCVQSEQEPPLLPHCEGDICPARMQLLFWQQPWLQFE